MERYFFNVSLSVMSLEQCLSHNRHSVQICWMNDDKFSLFYQRSSSKVTTQSFCLASIQFHMKRFVFASLKKLKRKIWNVAWICPYKSFHKMASVKKWNWQVISLHYFFFSLHHFFPIFEKDIVKLVKTLQIWQIYLTVITIHMLLFPTFLLKIECWQFLMHSFT